MLFSSSQEITIVAIILFGHVMRTNKYIQRYPIYYASGVACVCMLSNVTIDANNHS